LFLIKPGNRLCHTIEGKSLPNASEVLVTPRYSFDFFYTIGNQGSVAIRREWYQMVLFIGTKLVGSRFGKRARLHGGRCESLDGQLFLGLDMRASSIVSFLMGREFAACEYPGLTSAGRTG
jgi:hypothetical protein